MGLILSDERCAMGVGLLDHGDEPAAVRRITVLLVGPIGLVRAALRQFLSAAAEVSLLADLLPGQETLDVARRSRPEIALVDAPELDDALAVVRGLLAVSPETRPIILSDEEFDGSFRQAVAAGVWGILLRDLTQSEVIRAVRAVARGKAVIGCALDPAQMRQLQELPSQRQTPDSAAAVVLTERETSVMQGVAAGQTDSQIARQLGVAVPTIKSHIRTILRKTRAPNRAAAIAAVFRSGTFE